MALQVVLLSSSFAVRQSVQQHHFTKLHFLACRSIAHPQQFNDFDCGVFTLMFASQLAFSLDLQFIQQSDMPDTLLLPQSSQKESLAFCCIA